jgi:uncharacterized membrane protein
MNKDGVMPAHERKQRATDYLLLHLTFFLYSLSAVLAKTAAIQGLFTYRFFLFAFAELIFLGIYALLWQQALRRFPLVKAFSNKGAVVIWNLLWAAVLFHEQITVFNLIGSLIIMIGIMVVSSDDV